MSPPVRSIIFNLLLHLSNLRLKLLKIVIYGASQTPGQSLDWNRLIRDQGPDFFNLLTNLCALLDDLYL